MATSFRRHRQNTRWSIIVLTAFVLACAAAACQQKQTGTNNQAANTNQPPATQNQAATPEQAAVKIHRGVGVIKKITPADPSVEIDHEEIKGYMPAMRMEYYVKDKSLIDSLKPGDKVDFAVEDKQGVEVISEIKKR